MNETLNIPHQTEGLFSRLNTLSKKPLVTPNVCEQLQFQHQDIAIIGMSGIFPESPDLNTFWQNLLEGCTSKTVLAPFAECAAGSARKSWQGTVFSRH